MTHSTSMKLTTASLPVLAALSSAAIAQAIPEHQKNNAWFIDARDKVETRIADTENTGSAARNAIVFVGDGMGLSTITAARIFAGQSLGQPGEEAVLSFETLPFTALVKTYNVDAQIPDSAGTMSAMMSGVKTDAGVIGLDEEARRGNCDSAAGREVTSLLELAELQGLSTGIVTTTRITHATPAATYANTVDRGWEDDSVMPIEALNAGCQDIAQQLVTYEARIEARHADFDIDGIDVAMGGGRRHFLPADASQNPNAIAVGQGRRIDGVDLILQWQELYPNGSYLDNREDFDAYDPESEGPVLALFNDSHLQYSLDSAATGNREPSLAEMTGKAIAHLDNNANGYLLVVEAGRIDHAHHAGNAHSALSDTLALAEAVEVAQSLTSTNETLIMVTADHGHVLSIAGYPKRGNPILGKVVEIGQNEQSLATDGLPYTTLSYFNGRGFRNFGNETNADASYTEDLSPGRFDLNAVDTTLTGFHQEALVPLEAESHAGEDVALHASGPGASAVSGVIEQNMIHHIINRALGLTVQ